ncbi:MAG: dienelactone hydrolase family protein [Holophagaceae bacterium]
MHPTQTQWLALEAADGTRFEAFLARPTGVAPAPPLLLFQEIFGVNDHIQGLCARFAAEGFTVLAPDLFHRTAPRFTTSYDDYKPGREEAAKMTLEGLEADCLALKAWADADPATADQPMAAVGYCMGGRIAFLAHTMLPLACAVTYYGGQIPTHLDRVPKLSGPHLFLWGGADEAIPADQRRAVEEALAAEKKSYLAAEFVGAGHGFNCDQRASYHAEAADLAWAMTLRFTKKHLGILEDDY